MLCAMYLARVERGTETVTIYPLNPHEISHEQLARREAATHAPEHPVLRLSRSWTFDSEAYRLSGFRSRGAAAIAGSPEVAAKAALEELRKGGARA